MQRSRVVSFVLISAILCVVAAWTYFQFDRQSNRYLNSVAATPDSQYYAAINSTTTNFEREQIEKVGSIKLAAVKRSEKQQTSYKILPKVTSENLKALCTWTHLRLAKLDNEIRKSGQGSNSQYCEEFDLRRKELVGNNCSESFDRNYSDYC